MKKKIKIVLIVVGTLVVLCLILVGGFMYKFNAETKKMHPVETGNVVDCVYAIKDDFVNMFLIKEGNQYVAHAMPLDVMSSGGTPDENVTRASPRSSIRS